MLRHTIFGTTAPDRPATVPGQVTLGELRSAARFDPTAFRGYWEVVGMLRRPTEVYADPDIVARTRRALRDHRDGADTGPGTGQPSREQLLAALKAT
jgi:hypothetical protein